MTLEIRQSHAGAWRRTLSLALASGIALAAPAAVALDTYSISGHVIAAGAEQGRQSACFTLSGTAGQAVVAVTGDTNDSVSAGFWRAFPPDQDSVFASSFEDCGS